ncbi:MAG: hypothetical protein HC888_13370 [Candidatus Competibacteraceae bacterium]|nr:hypothetical protein [Candidatus Competibacteraceae bacterium]
MIDRIKKVKLVTDTATIYATVSKLYPEGRAVLLRLKDYPDRTTAEPLLGATVFTQRSQMGGLAEDEFWINDLIGMDAYTTGGTKIGTISAVYGEGNQLLEVTATDIIFKEIDGVKFLIIASFVTVAKIIAQISVKAGIG